MNKGFTLKSFVVILAILIIMVLIAFFVQRNGEEAIEEDFIEEDFQEEADVSENEEEIVEDIPDNEEEELENEEPEYGDNYALIERSKKDLSQVLEIDIDKIVLVEIKESLFSDHTLGTSRPGEVYDQQPTKGYIIILSASEKEYRYHGNEDNLFLVE